MKVEAFPYIDLEFTTGDSMAIILIFSRYCGTIPSVILLAVRYDRLFHLLIDKKMTNAQLAEKAQVSANIISRLKKDQYISMESIEKICNALNCGLDDIMEFVNDK